MGWRGKEIMVAHPIANSKAHATNKLGKKSLTSSASDGGIMKQKEIGAQNHMYGCLFDAICGSIVAYFTCSKF